MDNENYSDITLFEAAFIIGGWALILGGYIANSFLHFLY